MVDLEPEDYSVILRWFESMFAKVTNVHDIPMKHKRTFWKLTFMAEDKIKEVRENKEADTE